MTIFLVANEVYFRRGINKFCHIYLKYTDVFQNFLTFEPDKIFLNF